MGAINISSVGKVYPNGTRALEDVNIEINDGEFVVLVGPSGCGKTTLLRMVAGLEDITEGEISIADNIVNEVAPKDRDIAMVFQNYALYPHMSVYDNMAFSLKLRKLPKDEIEKKVKDAAKTLEIDELLERKPKALSGGQRQRAAMGRAIVRSPQAFLMDEPLSNLDAKLRVQMRAELGQLHTQLETTTLYVTHDQVEAMTMGDRVAVIRKGILQQIDIVKPLFKESSFVTEFAIAGAYWKIPVEELATGFSFNWIENQVLVVTKSLPMGQSKAQNILDKIIPQISEGVDRAKRVAQKQELFEWEFGRSLPGVAILSAQHEYLESRLYRS